MDSFYQKSRRKSRRPDPSHANTIKNMSAPINVSSLQSFLGLANCYCNYIPNMHTLKAPLNKLLKKDVKWNWLVNCQKAFDNLKTALTSDLTHTLQP